MSIKKRIKDIESKAGVGSDVHIHISHTIYEAKGGGIDSEFFQAFMGQPKKANSCFCIRSTDKETEEEFLARIEARCIAAFGCLPRNWLEERR